MSSITLSLALRGRLLSGTQTTFQGALFGNSEPGFTFEPWDMTTLYQDRAGTTPVTAAGQSVGLRLDKSKGLALGAELVAPLISDALWVQMPATPNSSVSGNQLTFGGQFSGRRYAVNTTNPSSRYEFRFNARRVSGNASIFFFHEASQSGNISPLTLTDTMSSYVIRPQGAAGGGLVSFGFQDRNASGFGTIEVTNISVRELAGTHEVAINDAARGIYGWMPKTGRRNKLNATDTLATQSVTVTAAAHTLAFTGTGTVTLSGTSTAGPLVGTGADNRVTLTFTPTAGSLTLTVTGSVTLAQLQLGSVDTAYQRVVSNYDITEAGVPSCYYVLANGVNTAYVTPTIAPGTDKVQVFAGVRKNSDAALGMMAELGNGNFNAFKLFAPRTASNNYAFSSGGTVLSEVTASGFSAPITNVLTGLGDISGDRATLRVNGTQVAQSTADQGTGNYLAYPAYIYARGGTSLPFNGYDFGHAVRFGPNLDAATIARVESLIARNTPEVTL